MFTTEVTRVVTRVTSKLDKFSISKDHIIQSLCIRVFIIRKSLEGTENSNTRYTACSFLGAFAKV